MSSIPNRSIPAVWTTEAVWSVLLTAIMIAQYSDVAPLNSYKSAVDVSVGGSKSVGAAVFVIGGINAVIETGHWRRYFEERLKDIVLQQNYLNRLDTKALCLTCILDYSRRSSRNRPLMGTIASLLIMAAIFTST